MDKEFITKKFQHHIFAVSGWISARNCKLLQGCSLEGNNTEKHVSNIIFVVRRLFIGVMRIRKYAIHTFQRQMMKNGCILMIKLFIYKNGHICW